MPHLEDVNSYCSSEVIDNLYKNYNKVIGVESDLELLNENNKCIGRILLVNGVDKFGLDYIVQFNKEKIKWSSSKILDSTGFYLIDAYWATPYAALPKIPVPIDVYNPKTKKIEVEIQRMNYKQYKKRKIYLFTMNFKYKYIAAYENFYILMSAKNPYYYCINSTIKNYQVEQEELTKIISVINNKKREIKKEWNILLNQAVQNSQSIAMANKLFERRTKEKKHSNVVQLSKN